jgi:hypothetical protein
VLRWEEGYVPCVVVWCREVKEELGEQKRQRGVRVSYVIQGLSGDAQAGDDVAIVSHFDKSLQDSTESG